MNRVIKILLLVVSILLVLSFFGSFYIVDETQQAIITQFGKPVGEPQLTPGLKIKLPFIQKVHLFDSRYLEWDGDPNQIPTQDKRFIWVDSYARWRISDPLLFFQRLWDERGAQSRLDDILDGETRNVIAKYALLEVVRTSNRDFDNTGVEMPSEEAIRSIEHGRSKLEKEVLANASARTSDLGMEILDFRFKRINYEEGVRNDVYARMVSERKRMAEQYRAEGAGEAARIHGDRDRDLKEIQSGAYRESQEIIGRSDAEAADIYASAYGKAPDFYRFLQTMRTYSETLDENTTIIVGTSGQFLQFLE